MPRSRDIRPQISRRSVTTMYIGRGSQ